MTHLKGRFHRNYCLMFYSLERFHRTHTYKTREQNVNNYIRLLRKHEQRSKHLKLIRVILKKRRIWKTPQWSALIVFAELWRTAKTVLSVYNFGMSLWIRYYIYEQMWIYPSIHPSARRKLNFWKPLSRIKCGVEINS